MKVHFCIEIHNVIKIKHISSQLHSIRPNNVLSLTKTIFFNYSVPPGNISLSLFRVETAEDVVRLIYHLWKRGRPHSIRNISRHLKCGSAVYPIQPLGIIEVHSGQWRKLACTQFNDTLYTFNIINWMTLTTIFICIFHSSMKISCIHIQNSKLFYRNEVLRLVLSSKLIIVSFSCQVTK